MTQNVILSAAMERKMLTRSVILSEAKNIGEGRGTTPLLKVIE
jgi:hypothetical protein